MQCKVLRLKDLKKMESEVNSWLESLGNLDIKHITTTVSQGGVMYVSVFY